MFRTSTQPYGRFYIPAQEKIRSWNEFGFAWEKYCICEAAAIGLLYEGAALPIPEKDDRAPTDYKNNSSGLTAERVDFFLAAAMATYKNSERITEVAAQQLVRHLLAPALANCELTDAHGKIIAFLKKKPASLLRPPYPRLIAQYLSSVFNHCDSEISKLSPGQMHEVFAFYKKLTGAMCTWGLSYELAYAETFKVSHSIYQFLCSMNTPISTQIRATFLPWEKSLIEDHTAKNVREELCGRAIIAFLQRKYMYPND
jgi:hypothetical protein